ncbi:hypothetical protein MferCBS49748_000379 [Microsporum ferrugineum]
MGHLLDWKFKRIARSLGLPVDRKRAQSIKEFPIERARISLIFPFLYAGMAAMMAYGWALDRKVMLAGPLILQFVAGFCIGSSFTAMSTLLVDLYPSNPSAVTAASNLTRCMLGAGATASFSPLIERIGVGWCFTVWCLLTVGFSPGLWAVIQWGPGWREERRQRVAMVTTSVAGTVDQTTTKRGKAEAYPVLSQQAQPPRMLRAGAYTA